MVLSRETQEFWIRAGVENGGYGPDTRLLVASPLIINAAYARSCACLRVGAAVISVGGDLLAQMDVSHVFALPLRLEELMDELAPGFAARANVVVGTVGGFVTPVLRERARKIFSGRILSRYGANETSGICEDLDATGVGLLSAGVDLRIVDDDGRDLPAGEYGIVAVRTPGMAERYIDDPEATRAAFRDGWFHSTGARSWVHASCTWPDAMTTW